MNDSTARRLTEKFFDGATTLREEQQLYRYYASGDVADDLMCHRQMFRDYRAMQQVVPKAAVRPLSWRTIAAAAAALLLLIGSLGGYRWHEDQLLAATYGGSYIIMNGQRIDDLRRISHEIEATLATASRIEQQASRQDIIEQATQDVLKNISDPQQRQQLSELLND